MSKTAPRELARIGALAAAAAWLLRPFATGRLYGAGDALWYANMLADFVTQVRSGIFPVFAGQTEFAFNGAVYPLRVAPLFQHLAGLLDLLTGRSLGFFALQHLAVIVCGVAGIFACYLTLCRIAPRRRWSAVGFSILYLSCPGLLATIYTQDLYMTWMTVPIAPLAAYGIMRTYRRDDVTSQCWLAAPLAALWLAHAPIALWFTLIAAASQIVRLAAVDRGWPSVRRALLGAGLFCLLAHYPFLSVAELRSPGQDAAAASPLAHPEQVAVNIRSVFPAVVLPLSDHARALSDLQLGYGLWIALAGIAVAAVRRPSSDVRVVLFCAATLLVLLLPLDGLTGFLWGHIPATVVRITYYWPMQRFYIIIASLLAVAGQAAVGSMDASPDPLRRAVAWALCACCAWSLWESRQFIRAAADRTASPEVSARSQLRENLMLTNDSYGLFGNLPANFSNGVMDAAAQVRLRTADPGQFLYKPERRVIESGSLTGSVDVNPGILDLEPSIRLEPGRRYRFELQFARDELQGILQLTGRHLFRQYKLPSSGEEFAFGSGPHNVRIISLWSSDPGGDTVSMRFIPSGPGAKPADFAEFGTYKLREVVPEREPVLVTSLVPFTATVRASGPALLETPRMFMPGYRATLDGRPVGVGRSENGLASLSVPTGTHAVVLWFAAPRMLAVSFWASVGAWAATLLVVLRRARRPPQPVKS